MLAIRFQRVGRKGHAEFRVIVQEARRSPSSGAIVAQIGHYNPHSKTTVLDKEKALFYVGNGAQPSPRVASLLKNEGVKLPDWVKIDTGKKRSIKNSDKLRRNRPAGEPAPEKPVVEEKVESEEVTATDTESPETPTEGVATSETPETEANPESVEKAEEKTAEAETETTENTESEA